MSRHGFRATVFAFCLPLVGALSATSGYAISKDFDQTYPLQPCGTFELQNVNGPVDVQGWDRNEVEIHAVKTAKQRETDLERVSIEVDARPDAVAVTTRYPQNQLSGTLAVGSAWDFHVQTVLLLGDSRYCAPTRAAFSANRMVDGLALTRIAGIPLAGLPCAIRLPSWYTW